MPAKSVNQQKFMALVDLYKRKKIKRVSKAVKDAAKSMTKKEIKEFARTSHKGLPKKVKKSKAQLAYQDLDQLISLANTLDQKGLYKEADMLDDAIFNLENFCIIKTSELSIKSNISNQYAIKKQDIGSSLKMYLTANGQNYEYYEFYLADNEMYSDWGGMRFGGLKIIPKNIGVKNDLIDLLNKHITKPEDSGAKGKYLDYLNNLTFPESKPVTDNELNIFNSDGQNIIIPYDSVGEIYIDNIRYDDKDYLKKVLGYLTENNEISNPNDLRLANNILQRLETEGMDATPPGGTAGGGARSPTGGGSGGGGVRPGQRSPTDLPPFPLTIRHRNDNNVKILQKSLIKLLRRELGTTGTDGDGADGDFGKLTLAAVNQYLTTNGKGSVSEVDEALFNEIKGEADKIGAGGGGATRVDPTTPTETISGGTKVIFLKNPVDNEELGIMDVDPTSTNRIPLSRRFFYAKKISGNWTIVKKQDLTKNQIGALQPVLKNLRRQNPVGIGRGGGGRRARRSGLEATPTT